CYWCIRVELLRLLEHVLLVGGHVDGSLRSLGEICNAAQMVPVGVRDENRRATCAHLRKFQPELRRARARVDDHRLRGGPGTAHDVAVRSDGAELVTIDDERHDG